MKKFGGLEFATLNLNQQITLSSHCVSHTVKRTKVTKFMNFGSCFRRNFELEQKAIIKPNLTSVSSAFCM